MNKYKPTSTRKFTCDDLSQFYTQLSNGIHGDAVSINEKEIIENTITQFNEYKKNSFFLGENFSFVINMHEGKFHFISPEAKEMLKVKENTDSFKVLFDRIHDSDRTNFFNMFYTLSNFWKRNSPEEAQNYIYSCNLRMQFEDGDERIYLLQTMIPIPGGSFNIGIATDITHLKTDSVFSFSILGLNERPSYLNMQLDRFFTDPVHAISQREKQIIKLLTLGNTSKSIADQLFISYETVESHRKNILRKTFSKNTKSLVINAFKNGWV